MRRNGKAIWLLVTMLALSALFLAACSGTEQTSGDSSDVQVPQGEVAPMDNEHEDEHEEGDQHSDGEHMEGEHDDDHEHAEVPHEYEDLKNPFAGDSAAVAAGAELFDANCASCHGETGLGDGPAAVGLDPKPASLADSSMMSDLTDAYIFWRITEGGTSEPFNSAMPPWGDAFTEEQRWQLVSFVRSLAK